ncbi:MAG: [LysW]-lysine hydrolase [Acidobacteriota bacterium]
MVDTSLTNSELRLLRQMLEIYSPSQQEAEVSAFLVEEMRRRGFTAYQDSVRNAIGVLGQGERTVVLLGHMDTVPGKIRVEEREGKLYGRGAVDAKGPLACFISAASRLKPDLTSLNLKLVVVGAVEEEAATSRGALQVRADFSPPDFCIIGEPSRWHSITLGYKGRLLLDYRLEIPLKHTAAAGKLVCEQAFDFWETIKVWCADFNQDKSAFEVLDPSIRSFNSQSDGLTEIAEMKLGFRLPVDFPVGEFRKFLTGAAGTALLSFSGGELAVRKEKSNSLVRAFLAAIRRWEGQPKFKVKTGTSDMNVVASSWTCPMLAYGPGDSALDHTPDEHIEIEEYARAVNVLESALRQL